MLKKALMFLVISIIVLSIAAASVSAADAMTFSFGETYRTQGQISAFPVTFEATVSLPPDTTGRGGVIVGNFAENAACLNFEIYNNGQPRIYYRDDNGTVGNYSFESINVCTGVPVHIAIVMDSINSVAYCYIDGQLKATMNKTAYPTGIAFPGAMALGGDLRDGNGQYFKGTIYDVCLYSDMRSDAEIFSDYSTDTTDTDNLIASYDLTAYEGSPDVIEDISGSGNDLYLGADETWITKEPVLNPYDYSFAVVGDTQIVNRDYPEKFSGIYDWILENLDKYNTRCIIGLGDITDDNTDREYALADAVFQRLKGVVPFTFVRGNHDKTDKFNEYFTVDRYGSQVSGYYNNKMENTCLKFDVGNIKYMLVNIDCGAADDMLAWANKVCEENPDRNIIVTTHGYLGGKGQVLAGSAEWPSRWGPNDPQTIWDSFVSRHKNIVMVLCGHSPSGKIQVSENTGVNGNTVKQVLIDHQGIDSSTSGGVGIVVMLHFSNGGRTIQVSCYSTIKQAYYLRENQFSFDIETSTSDIPKVVPAITDSNIYLTLPSGEEIKASVTLDTDRYTFTSDAQEDACLTMSVDTGGTSSGKIIASLYDTHNRLITTKIYDCAPTVDVSFDNVSSEDTIRLHWWNGLEIMPIGNGK